MKNPQKIKRYKYLKRKKRVRVKIFGTAKRPRLSVYRSLKYIYSQLIDDTKGVILISVSDLKLSKKEVKTEEMKNLRKNEKKAFMVGLTLSKKAQAKGISKVVFDRGGFKYSGRIKALVLGARTGGLKF